MSEPQILLTQCYAYEGNANHESEAQGALRRFQKALEPVHLTAELCYQGAGRNREALVIAHNGTRLGAFKLSQHELAALVLSALAGAVAAG